MFSGASLCGVREHSCNLQECSTRDTCEGQDDNGTSRSYTSAQCWLRGNLLASQWQQPIRAGDDKHRLRPWREASKLTDWWGSSQFATPARKGSDQTWILLLENLPHVYKFSVVSVSTSSFPIHTLSRVSKERPIPGQSRLWVAVKAVVFSWG